MSTPSYDYQQYVLANLPNDIAFNVNGKDGQFTLNKMKFTNFPDALHMKWYLQNNGYTPEPSEPTITVNGGIITHFTRSGINYTEILFKSSGSIQVNTPMEVRYALGGSGPSGSTNNSSTVGPGGGSAGQLLQKTLNIEPGNHVFNIGAGGAAQTSNLQHGNPGNPSTWVGPSINLLAEPGVRGGTYISVGGTIADYSGANAPNASGGMGSGSGYPGGVGENNGGAGVTDTITTNRAGGGGAGAGGPGQDATPGQGGKGGDGVYLDWIAEPKYVCGGVGGCGEIPGASGLGAEGSPTIRGAGPTKDAVWGCPSGSINGPTNPRTSGKGGDGFLFIVVKSDDINVVETPPADADFSRISFSGSSSSEYSGTEFSTMVSTLGASTILEGKAGERAEQTTARLGSHPWSLSFPNNEIPASDSVLVTVNGVTPSGSSYLKSFTGIVAGVAGTVSYSSVDTSLQFTRTVAGEVVTLEGSTEFIPDITETIRNHPACLWIGKNNLTSSIAPNTGEYVAEVHTQVRDWLRPLQKRVIVFSQFCNTGTSEVSSVRTRINTCNDILKQQFGNAYIDVLAWMRDPATWARMGLTQTETDISELALGNLPPSFARDTMHFSNEAEEDLHNNATKSKLIELGWYTEQTGI